MDPQYDYDFTKIDDKGKKFMRGGLEYRRPCGWKRYALKVIDKYKDIEWLGSKGSTKNDSEWAVSYHGTKIYCAEPIAKDGLKPGHNNKYGMEFIARLILKQLKNMLKFLLVLQLKKNIKLYFKIGLNQVQLLGVNKREDQMIIGMSLMEKI